MSDVLVERDGSIATIVLNRPRMRNAINLAMWTEIARASRALGGDDRHRRLRELSLEAFASQDEKEGTRAFLEQRPPRFQGR